jgi:predicted peroxiredoxin
LEAGHEVDVFVAGDGVSNLRPETLDAGHGIGTGSLREHVDALIAGGVTIHASGMSSNARGLGPDSLGGLAVTMAPPTRLVELAFAADRVLVY